MFLNLFGSCELFLNSEMSEYLQISKLSRDNWFPENCESYFFFENFENLKIKILIT